MDPASKHLEVKKGVATGFTGQPTLELGASGQQAATTADFDKAFLPYNVVPRTLQTGFIQNKVPVL